MQISVNNTRGKVANIASRVVFYVYVHFYFLYLVVALLMINIKETIMFCIVYIYNNF